MVMSFNEDELLKIAEATSGPSGASARQEVARALAALRVKIESAKNLDGDECREALKQLMLEATARRHEALQAGASDHGHPQWAAAAVCETWLHELLLGTPEGIARVEKLIDSLGDASSVGRDFSRAARVNGGSSDQRTECGGYQVEELAVWVNDLLSRFLEIQREITGLPWWRHLPIPGLFRAIDFAARERSLIGLLTEFEDVRRRSSELRGGGTASNRDTTFLDSLDAYSSALHQAVESLTGIVSRLYLKSRGDRSYRWANYKIDHAKFVVLEKNYVSLGVRLNRLFSALQRSDDRSVSGDDVRH